nr:hypothetical protein [uncultured Oscillibacter sp.]
MVGYFAWAEPGKGQKSVRLEERHILRMRFLQAEVAKSPHMAILRRRCVAAGKRLRKRGVTQVVLPEDFPFREELAKCGLRPVSTLALRRSVAADWVRAGLAAKDQPVAGARVAVAAAALTGEVVRTVTELCLRHRYVLLDLPYGGEELCRQLRREYGVSLLLGPSKDQLEGAEALVLFDPRTDLSRKNPVALRLYDENQALPPLMLPPSMEEALPEGADRGQLLAVLREAGALKREQIALGMG